MYLVACMTSGTLSNVTVLSEKWMVVLLNVLMRIAFSKVPVSSYSVFRNRRIGLIDAPRD